MGEGSALSVDLACALGVWGRHALQLWEAINEGRNLE